MQSVMTEPAATERQLDFAVIGAEKGGTSSLWEGMRYHPQIALPADKERPFFHVDHVFAAGLPAFIGRTFPTAGADARLGLVTPSLMTGDRADLDRFVHRIAGSCPRIRLVAILRDPIERAVSALRVRKRIGQVPPDMTLEAYVARTAREDGTERGHVPVLAFGEYGRILARYLEDFPREQVLVLFNRDLDRHPDRVFRALFTFLGVDADWSVRVPRVNVGGSAHRVSLEALMEVFAEMDRSVWPHFDDPNVRAGFQYWMRHLWNVEPDAASEPISPAFRAWMARRYLHDARVLRERLDVRPPWVPALREAAAGG